MTPAEISRWRAGYFWRREQDDREHTRQAWLTAMLMRQRTVPALADVLGDRRTRRLSARDRTIRQAEFDDMVRRHEASSKRVH